MEIVDVSKWQELADREWTKPTTKARKVRQDVLKDEIWHVLEKQEFDFRSLQALENLQLLEKYLWPGYNADCSNFHVLLIALMVTVKRRECVPPWTVFSDSPENFSSFFRRTLFMSIDGSLSINLRNHILNFLIGAFQSLDSGIVRKECAPLVSISIWHHLNSEQAREIKFEEHGALRKAWKASGRRYEAADDQGKAKLDFERSWLYSMLAVFINLIYSDASEEVVIYCERFLELLTDIESQLPTRRYVNTLIHDWNLPALIRNSTIYGKEQNGLFRDIYTLLQHFAYFPINDQTGAQYDREEFYKIHCARLAKLQKTSFKSFKDKLTILALSNYGSIEKRPDLESHLSVLTDQELVELINALQYRSNYPASANVPTTRELLLDILILNHERRKSYQETIQDLPILPTDTDLYDPSLMRNESYNGSRSLAIPKLNLQYLITGDFLWRSYVLFRSEAFFEIRKDLEDTIKRMQPRLTKGSNNVLFSGFSRMALPIPKPGILEVAQPKVGFSKPAFVRAEIVLDVSKLADNVRLEWDSLKPDDVVFLIAAKPNEANGNGVNGYNVNEEKYRSGLRHIRAAEVVQVLDENGRALRDSSQEDADGYTYRPHRRRLLVNIDTSAWVQDEAQKEKGKPDVYESINVIVRRKGRENNFKQILDSVKGLAQADTPLPEWLQDVFLGFGDPASANYTHLTNKLASLDLRDTFLDWQHLVESLPGKAVEPDPTQASSFGPPYVLEIAGIPPADPRPTKKRRREGQDAVPVASETVKVSTYRLPNNGPFVYDEPKRNLVRFTPTQIDAIVSGTQPGLTVIVGPPGTGKTDVATQIINNLYHDFPQQRTLLIAHSNQALNQLFQKITQLDIDHRHLLRLGHGEEDLETDVSYSKHGRVESFLENRARFLAEVDHLAANLGAPGAHGNSCETADYFKSVYVVPAWAKFWQAAESSSFDGDVIRTSFPFYQYFSSAPQPLFPEGASDDKLVDIAKGCERHIEKVFTELESIRPFEVLRNPRDRANYLLIKEARIIAMTSTHAAMRRQEIADLGFHYDNVVMEEAAQITEIENFIPMTLQKPVDGKLPLQRIVLCGDHYQNSPIIQNMAFRQYANLEQSLFLRLVRLGVPVINLDRQGRARPSIADLYRWRYEKLGDLPNVTKEKEYLRANAGFRYDYQFIDVPDYKGRGEMQPSPHFIQNLGEAEYAVAIYQYMRLLGYPSSKISILTPYAGQRALIRDVLNHRCAKNRLFGLPRIVTTVDKYQGEQNDCKCYLSSSDILLIDQDVILSLVRTNRVGYLRDIRRLTVALSRARLGLYILGRREVFELCFELKEAFDRLLTRPTSLQLTQGELFPASREVNAEAEATEMTGVEHLGQYVYEMTQAKIKQLNAGEISLPPIEEAIPVDEEEQVNDAEEDEDEDLPQPEEMVV
jgi:intron-binding protein aquarius